MKKTEPKNSGAAIAERAIQQVFVARDPRGAPLHQIAVQLKTYRGLEWHLLDSGDLQHGKTAALVRLVDHIGGEMPLLEAAELKYLCRLLLKKAECAITVVKRGGFYSLDQADDGCGFFAFRGQIYPTSSNTRQAIIQIESNADREKGGSHGSLKHWQETVGRVFSGNPYLILGLGCALSAALIAPLRLDSLVYAMVGPSSSGKSTVQRAIQSLFARGDGLESASGTVVGIHQLASEYSDSPLLLDEIRQMKDADGLVNFLFDVGNSSTRKVGTAQQSALRGGKLRCSVITANEKTIAELAARRGVPVDAGVYARVFEVQLEGVAGAFDKIPKDMSPALFAERIAALSSKFYGAVWPAWLRVVSARMKALMLRWKTHFKKRRTELASIANIDDRIGRRMVRGLVAWEFALLVAAGKGLIPLEVAEVKNAFETVLLRYQARRTAKLTPREQQIVDHYAGLIEQNRNRFVLSDAEAAKAGRPWGYVMHKNGQTHYWWFQVEFIRAAGDFGKDEAAWALKKAGFLDAKVGITKVIKINGKSVRVFAISDAIRFCG